MHADSSVAPVMLENLPASHFVHTSADVAPPWFSAWYVPAGHSRQTPSLYAPTTAEYLPAGHSRQALSAEAAVDAEYLPEREGGREGGREVSCVCVRVHVRIFAHVYVHCRGVGWRTRRADKWRRADKLQSLTGATVRAVCGARGCLVLSRQTSRA